MAFDFKKEYKEFYMPKNKPVIVNVPEANYIAVRGEGNPNEEGGSYQQAIGVLYAIAYTLRMSYKTDYKIEGFFEYVVPPLEGFWWQDDIDGVNYADKDSFHWISVIRLPDFVNEKDFEWAVETATKKKRLCHNKQLINSHFYRGVSELPYKLLFAVIYTHLEFRYEVSHTITSHHVHHFHQTRIPDGTLLDYMVQYRKPLFPQFFLYPKKFLPENNPHHKEFHLRPYIQNNANQ